MLLEYDSWCCYPTRERCDMAAKDVPNIFTSVTLEAAHDALKRVPDDAWEKATERILRERAEGGKMSDLIKGGNRDILRGLKGCRVLKACISGTHIYPDSSKFPPKDFEIHIVTTDGDTIIIRAGDDELFITKKRVKYHL